MTPEVEVMEELIERAAELIASAPRVVVFTGAGVSTESGIPDFRGPGGIWSRYDPEDFTIQRFLSNAETRRLVWDMMGRSGLTARAEPNPTHHAIARLERLGKLDCIITQNVDNLHQAAGNSPDRVLELHGNMQWARCLGCERRYPMEEVAGRLWEEAGAPVCPECRGILKPDAVFFGEALSQDTLSRATERSRGCDIFLVIGSTLTVTPAAFMPQYAWNAGAKLIIVNLTPTSMDRQASVVIRGKAGDVMPRIVERVEARVKVR